MKYCPNMIIVSGDGKNVGKTWLSCRLIQHLAQSGYPVTALKTSPHLHPLSDCDIIIARNNYFNLIDEHNISSKDSSRMLQAGAKRSFFLQYSQVELSSLTHHLLPFLPENHILVCETGSLHEVITPEASVFIERSGTASDHPGHINKPGFHFVIKPEEVASFDVKMFNFEHNKINVFR